MVDIASFDTWTAGELRMSQNCEADHTVEQPTVRLEWQRPLLRALDAQAAEGHAGNVDDGAFGDS